MPDLSGKQMYKREFENLILNNKLPKSILLYGNCAYQIELYTDKILSNINALDEEKMKLHFDEYNFSTAKNFLSQSSLFGDRNILIIKTDKVIPKKELDILVDLCFKNDTSFLIYESFADDAKGKNISKSFTSKKNANFVRFFKLNQGEAISLLLQKAKQIGLKINGYALSHLYQLQNENISLCVNDLEKLNILEKEIQISDIDEQIYGLGSIGMEKFIKDLLEKKDLKDFFQKFTELGSADEIRIINAIESYISTLFMFHSYIKIHGKFDPKEILGYPLPPQIANEKSKLSMKFGIETYDKVLKHLLKSELKLKKMQNIDKNSLLLSCLIKLQTLL